MTFRHRRSPSSCLDPGVTPGRGERPGRGFVERVEADRGGSRRQAEPARPGSSAERRDAPPRKTVRAATSTTRASPANRLSEKASRSPVESLRITGCVHGPVIVHSGHTVAVPRSPTPESRRPVPELEREGERERDPGTRPRQAAGLPVHVGAVAQRVRRGQLQGPVETDRRRVHHLVPAESRTSARRFTVRSRTVNSASAEPSRAGSPWRPRSRP